VPASRNRGGPRMSSVSQRVRTGVSAHGTPHVRYRTASGPRRSPSRWLVAFIRIHRLRRFHRFLCRPQSF
jgi:hypothetical protein